jgi:hypothetical protein
MFFILFFELRRQVTQRSRLQTGTKNPTAISFHFVHVKEEEEEEEEKKK